MVDRKKEPYPSESGVPPNEFDDAETTEFHFSEAENEIPELTDEAYPGGLPDDEHPADEIFPSGLLLGNRYEILELMHTGGMGHLYKARDSRLPAGDPNGALVAVKVLRRRLHERPDTKNLLELEAARARQLSHPNIINVYDFDEHEDQFFLVMEWLDGKSVQEMLQATRGRRLDNQFAWRVIDGAAKALQHAHDHGIVHADVNPSNVFVCDTQEIKLLDFGVARESGDDADAESIWVTPSYASPDVLAGNAPVIADDVFSLACVAYRLLAGKQAFDGMTPAEAKAKGIKPAPIAGLAADEWRMLSSALSFDPAERPASVVEFRRDAVPAAPAAESAMAAPASPAPRPPMALPPTWQIGTAAGIVVAGLLIWALWPSGGPEPSATAPEARSTRAAPAAQSSEIDPAPAAAVADSAAPAATADDAVDSPTTEPAEETSAPTPGAEESLAGSAAATPGTTAVSSDSTANDTSAAVASSTEPQPATGSEPAAAPDPAPVAAEATATEDTVATTAATAAGAAAAAATAAADTETPASGPAATSAEPSPVTATSEDSSLATDTAPDPLPGDGAATAAAASPEPTAFAETEPAPGPGDTAAPADDDTGGTGAAAVAAGAAAIALATPDALPSADSDDATVGSDAPAADAIANEPLAEDSPDEAGAAGEQELVAASAAEAPAAGLPQSGNKVEAPPEKEQLVPLSELNLERYVAPRFPRTARYREQSGYVDIRFRVLPDGSTGDIVSVASAPGDVFVESAQEAVSRWQFASRDEAVTAQVRLSFDVEQ